VFENPERHLVKLGEDCRWMSFQPVDKCPSFTPIGRLPRHARVHDEAQERKSGGRRENEDLA
jgi:hypothetical protein